MVNEGSLQEDLLAIPGVEGADVEGSTDKPAGLRIRIAEGADQQAVGEAIRRVLTSHGLGTDTRLPGESSAPSGSVAPVPDVQEPGTGGGEPAASATAVAVADTNEGAVIDLTERATEASEAADAAAAEAPEPEEAPEPAMDSAPAETEDDTEAPEPLVSPTDEAEAAAVVGHRPSREPVGAARLASVAVEEGRDGIVVTVASTDGTSVQQVAASTEGGVESAVVKATVRLALPDAPDASVIDVDDRRVEGVDIVMIVLDVDGHVYAGSAVVGAGRSFALGRATWAALNI